MGKNDEPFMFLLECCLPYPALPLTLDNVFEAVKTVRLSWRELAEELLGWYDLRSDDQKKLDAIERQHVSGEARLKAVVELHVYSTPWSPTNIIIVRITYFCL